MHIQYQTCSSGGQRTCLISISWWLDIPMVFLHAYNCLNRWTLAHSTILKLYPRIKLSVVIHIPPPDILLYFIVLWYRTRKQCVCVWSNTFVSYFIGDAKNILRVWNPSLDFFMLLFLYDCKIVEKKKVGYLLISWRDFYFLCSGKTDLLSVWVPADLLSDLAYD